jgi:peptidoglycan/LPS O-acetylase OafA/YrhL
MRLQHLFDPKANSLNFIRLLLAIGVIFVHAFALSGVPAAFIFTHLFENGFVDGFFAISGFLIVSSWQRNPHWGPYLRARVLRIFPAFWVCLIVTAFVLAPVGILTSGRGFPDGYLAAAGAFVFKNSALFITEFGIAGTPAGLVDSGWNGSLWTLFYEFVCYIGVLALGVAGLMKKRLTIPVLFALAELAVLATSYGPISSHYGAIFARFGVMFLAGAVIYRYQSKIAVRPSLIVAATVIVLASSALPDYRVIGAFPLAYLLISVGALVKTPRLRLPNDFSYGIYIYAFPVQQILVGVGAGNLGPLPYALLSLACTLPLAVASWFLIEKRALQLKKRSMTTRPLARADASAE